MTVRFFSFRRSYLSFYLLILLLFCQLSFALEQRPKIGLVLSGGGARGSAHIGVIEALETLHVPIDYIVGTSMGAVIGGLYASGIPIEKIKQDFCKLDWEKIFINDVPREFLYFRRKLDDDLFIISNFIGYSNNHLHLTFGLTSGQNLYTFFKSYLLPQEPIVKFANLNIPFKAISTDLLSGKVIALDEGDLALAMLASMAVPGLIAPVHQGSYLLVDGGVSDNLAITIAREMGADILIVVNVSTALYKEDQIYDLTSVLGQITNILTNFNIEKSKKKLQPQDILIEPILTLDTTAFEKFDKGIYPGKEATLLQSARLKAYAVKTVNLIEDFPPEENRERCAFVKIDHAVVDNPRRVCKLMYNDYLSFDDKELKVETISDRMNSLYGLNIYDHIFYHMQEDDGLRELHVEPQVKSNSLYFQESFFISTDFQDNNNFSFVMGVTNPHVNSLLGEWRFIGKAGSELGMLAEFYQPLEPSLRWFFNPTIVLEHKPFNLYFDYDYIGRYMINSVSTMLALGRNFSHNARIKAFWQLEYDDYRLTTGSSPYSEGHLKSDTIGVMFQWDVLDNLYFPHNGTKGEIVLSQTGNPMGFHNPVQQLASKGLMAFSSGKHSFLMAGIYNTTLNGNPNLQSKFFLGGLFQLSGLYDNEWIANNTALLTAIYYYEISKMNFIPNKPFPIFAGISLEGGKMWGEKNVLQRSHLISNSFFIGSDTIIGPIYLGLGLTANGSKAVHLLIGPFFR